MSAGGYCVIVTNPAHPATIPLAQGVIYAGMGITWPSCPPCPLPALGCDPQVFLGGTITWDGFSTSPTTGDILYCASVATAFRWYQACSLCGVGGSY